MICHNKEVAYLDGALLQLHLLKAHKPGASRLHLQVRLGPLLLPRLVWGSVQGTERPSYATEIRLLSADQDFYGQIALHITLDMSKDDLMTLCENCWKAQTYRTLPGMLQWPGSCPGMWQQ